MRNAEWMAHPASPAAPSKIAFAPPSAPMILGSDILGNCMMVRCYLLARNKAFVIASLRVVGSAERVGSAPDRNVTMW
jgi:hypothetical protein